MFLGAFLSKLSQKNRQKINLTRFSVKILQKNFVSYSQIFRAVLLHKFSIIFCLFHGVLSGAVLWGKNKCIWRWIKEKSLKKPHDGGVFWGKFRFVWVLGAKNQCFLQQVFSWKPVRYRQRSLLFCYSGLAYLSGIGVLHFLCERIGNGA